MSHLQAKTEVFNIEYPWAEELVKTQLTKCFWTADEILVEKDVHDVLTNLTESEKHGVFTTLKLFTLYELKAGAEYWCGRFINSFPRHELASMGSAFGMMELCVHKPFYNKINELLNASNAEFYTDYVNNPTLVARMKSIDDIIDDKDDLVSLGGFTLVEGVILYSNFAFLKHFQSLGKNKLLNIVRGINFSVRDENLHAVGGSIVFKELKSQIGITKEQITKIVDTAKVIYEHEEKIIDMIFEKGDIEGITSEDLKNFVKSRINICLSNLDIHSIYTIGSNPIAEWFYNSINSYQSNDFFSGGGREYTRDWSEDKFIW